MNKKTALFRSAIRILLILACLGILGATLPASADTTIPGGTLSTDTTWDLAGSPYIVTGDVTVQGVDGPDSVTTLTIDPGVEVRFDANSDLLVGSVGGEDPGALVADGDAGGSPATIVFTSNSATPSPGDWNHILFHNTAHDSSVLRNVRVEYGGASGSIQLRHSAGTITLDKVTVRNSGSRGIYFNGSSFDLSDCTVDSNSDHDLVFADSAAVSGTVQNCSSIESLYFVGPNPQVALTGNTFNNWGETTSQVQPDTVRELLEENTVTAVPDAELYVLPGTVTRDASWNTGLGDAYRIVGRSANLTVQGTDGADTLTTLTIEPGLELSFPVGDLYGGQGYLFVGGAAGSDPGALVADGDAGGSPATITFTNGGGTRLWGGILFEPTAHGSSVLRNVLVEYGGSIRLRQAAGTSITLDRLTVDSGSSGIDASADVVMSQVTVQNSTGTGIYIGADATMSQITVRDNGGRGIRFTGGGSFDLSQCTIESNADYDLFFDDLSTIVGTVQNCSSIESLYFQGANPQVTLTGNTFNNWGLRTSRVQPDTVRELTDDNTVNPVSGAALELTGGTVTRDATWTAALGNPYSTFDNTRVQGTDGVDGVTRLTIEPGLVVRVNGYLYIGGAVGGDPGALVADGDAGGNPAAIFFNANGGGHWGGIYFEPTAQDDSVLRHVFVNWSGYADAAVRLGQAAGTSITLDQVTVRDSGYRGIHILADAVLSQVTVEDSVNVGILVEANSDLSGVTVRNSGAQGIYLSGGTLDLTAGTVESGGSDGIYLASDATLSNVTVRDAASSGIHVSSGTLDLSQCTLESNGGYDLYFSSTPGITGTVQGCARIESLFYVDAGPSITWTGNTFENWGEKTSRVGPNDAGSLSRSNVFNHFDDDTVLQVVGGTIGVDSIWAPGPGPFQALGELTVQGTDGHDGITRLRLDPGLELRLGGGNSLTIGTNGGDPGELYSDGRLGGSFYDTIYLTSSHVVPEIGDWGGLRVLPTGWISVYETEIWFADTGLEVQGTFGPSDRVTVNRANTGFHLNGASFFQPLDHMVLRNCDTAVLANDVTPVIRNCDIFGATWGVHNQTPATVVDASDNWWGADDGPSGQGPGSGCPVSEGVLFDPYQDEPYDDGDGVDAITDNCPGIGNPSQRDSDGDAIGDACDERPVLRVSNEPADQADFDRVQTAVDAPYQGGMRIEILAGSGKYDEQVLVDRGQPFAFIGLDGPGDPPVPVIVDGGGGPAFEVTDGGGVPARFENLTLRGNQGIHGSADLAMSDLTFEVITWEALNLDAGVHTLSRGEFKDTVSIGADVAEGAQFGVSQTTMKGLSNAGLIVAGTAAIENTVISGGNGADGVRMAATGTLDVRYSTIADNTGVGIDNVYAGTVTIDRSILYGNVQDDMLNVGCDIVSWSDTGRPDCSFVNDNISSPLFPSPLDPDYRLTSDALCLDHGPDPATYDGNPPIDADGGPRLRDHDGNGLAHNDCGAYERANPALTPGAVLNVAWELNWRMIWDSELSAVEYHIYRDALSNLGYGASATCRDDLDGDRTDTRLDDMEEPLLPGTGFSYLVTAAKSGGEEGTLGFATGAERSNFNVCP